MFKFIHTADIHLDSPLKGLEAYEDAPIEEIRGATRISFDNLIDLAIAEEVDFILIAGDLYDGDWKDYNTGLFFSERMGRLAKAGIKVFIVSGNHDAASQITKAMPLPENVKFFSSRKSQSEKLEDLNVLIHGQSYSTRAVTENLASKFPQYDPNYFNIGLLHTCLTGREGHENYGPCSNDDLTSKGYDYWALGHIHKREIVLTDPMVLFPGNIQGRHVKETGAKGVTLVSVEDGRITEVQERYLDVLRWSVCRVDLSECETKEDVYEKVRSAIQEEQSLNDGKTLALRLQLEGRCSLHTELHEHSAQITEDIRGVTVSLGGVWLENVEIKTKRKTSIKEIVGEDTALADLLHAVENLDFGEDSLTVFDQDLASLKTKLPAEIINDDSMMESKAEYNSELHEDVKELLIARLIQHEDEV